MHLSDLQIDEGLRCGNLPQHLEECERCRLRWQELASDREKFTQRARPAAFADAVWSMRRRRIHFGWALVPALALLALVLWPASGVRVKGEPVAVELHVKSEGRTARFEPERRYHAGDALQVVYTALQPFHLTAVDVEGDKVSILAHDQLAPGTRRRLDRSFVLDEAGGDERIVLLFSEGDLSDDQVREAVRTGQPLPVAAQASFLIHR